LDIGLIYALLVGAIWAGVAAGYNAAARRGLTMTPFVAIAASSGAMLSALFTVHWAALPEWGSAVRLIVVISLSGLIGQSCMLMNGAAMRAAPERSAATWTILQMSMVIPFAAAVITGREHAGLYNWTALPLILIAAAFCISPDGSGSGAKSSNHRVWLVLVIVGFAFSGASQAIAQEVSLRGWPDVLNLRAPVSLAAGGGFLWLVSAVRKQRPTSRHWLVGGLTGCLVASGNVLLFASLDACAHTGRAYLVFPVAVGASILLFAAYQVATKNEACDARKLSGLALGVAGIAMLGLR
jgi:hypothetical protein